VIRRDARRAGTAARGPAERNRFTGDVLGLAERRDTVNLRSVPVGGIADLLNALNAAGPSVSVPIDSLTVADSPRTGGERTEHVRLLAETAEELPPILVHRRSMRVIDGMHRLRAAQQRGDRSVPVRFFEGDESLVFVAAVHANVSHGLPLSLADREAAAARILDMHGHWSNRVIAVVTGLAPNTVEVIRRRSARERDGQPHRLGRDGRVRPLSTESGRRRASEVIRDRPDASLRDIARLAGISVGTARDVRRRVAMGEDPVPTGRHRDGTTALEPAGSERDDAARQRDRPPARDSETILGILRRDPSLRYTESGRRLLRWLDVRTIGPQGWQSMLGDVPPHCSFLVAELAEACAEQWARLATRMRASVTAEE